MTDQPPPVAYVVCQAEYEAHGPVAVFTNAAAAERHAENSRTVEGGRYDVIPLPLLGVVPQRAGKHLHAGRVWRGTGRVEDEQAWTMDCWDHDVPARPVVTFDERQPNSPWVHVAAATAESAEAAFREAVEKVREAL